jgi:hypothetical protein
MDDDESAYSTITPAEDRAVLAARQRRRRNRRDHKFVDAVDEEAIRGADGEEAGKKESDEEEEETAARVAAAGSALRLLAVVVTDSSAFDRTTAMVLQTFSASGVAVFGCRFRGWKSMRLWMDVSS